jgi:hypothetical protein
MASSKDCPVWIREAKICKVKVTQNISYPEARKLVLAQTTGASATYAAATKASLKPSPPVPVMSVSCQTDLTWISSTIPMTRPSPTLSIKSLPAKFSSTSSQNTLNYFAMVCIWSLNTENYVSNNGINN